MVVVKNAPLAAGAFFLLLTKNIVHGFYITFCIQQPHLPIVGNSKVELKNRTSIWNILKFPF